MPLLVTALVDTFLLQCFKVLSSTVFCLFVCLFVCNSQKKHACNPGKVHCLKQANGKELDVLRERDFRAFGNIKSALGKSALDILPGSTAATQASAPSRAAIYRW